MLADFYSLKQLLPYFIGIGALTAYIAHKKKGRNLYAWFAIGFFFGLIGLTTLLILPSKLQEEKKPPEEPTLPVQKPILPMTKEEWYFLDKEHKQVGPLSFSQLKSHYQTGEISKVSYVWNGSLQNWEKLDALKEYVEILEERTT